MAAGGTFTQHAATFESAHPLESHEAFADHLDVVEALLTTGAAMAFQDAEIAATWLRRRRPKKGRRVPWAERMRLARRTRGHARHLARSLEEATRFVRRMREVHEDFVAKEKAAAGVEDPESEERTDE